MPAELLTKRDQLLVDLEKAAKAATHSTLQQVLQKMLVLVLATKHGTPLNGEACREIQEAFLKFADDPTTSRLPQALTDALAWLERYIVASVALLPKGAQAQLMESAPEPVKRGKDSFESSAKPRRTLSEELPATVGAADPVKPQPQGESFKAWMKNPGLGKLKG
jgi:hypothetical protein